MINQLLLVGKIKDMSAIDKNEIEVEVKRNYKNNEGIFEKDYFKCNLWFALSKKISVSCNVGDIVVVRGRLIDNSGFCSILAEQVILLNKVS